jgi:multiple sugar transport system substrate-binding protein
MRALFFLCLACLCGCNFNKPVEGPQELVILWAQWAPSDYLQTLSQGFTRETGIKVRVEQVPWNSFGDVFFEAMRRKDPKYDMVVGDSQWLGKGATNGFYVNLTSWFKAHKVGDIMTPASVVGYAEYPQGTGRYWGVPLEGDAMGFVYRRDLFEDPKEKEAFFRKYGYDLVVPSTWAQLRDIAEFFYRPDQGFYGVNIWGDRQYDGITMGVETFIWAYGADLGQPGTYKVRGILNVPAAAQGLKMYKQLHGFGAPEWRNAYLETNKAFMAGKTAMVMSYFAFFPDLLDPAKNPYAATTGFFANPAGPAARVTSLGGQGLSIVSYSRKKEAAVRFLDWFIRPDVQREWGRLGGYSCSREVLHSPEFLAAKPYNAALMESLGFMRDFWAVPEYLQLLEVSQKYWHRFLFEDDITAEEALDAVAREWESIFEEAGYYKE